MPTKKKPQPKLLLPRLYEERYVYRQVRVRGRSGSFTTITVPWQESSDIARRVGMSQSEFNMLLKTTARELVESGTACPNAQWSTQVYAHAVKGLAQSHHVPVPRSLRAALGVRMQ